MAEPLLTLETLTKRDHVLIDGRRVEMRGRNELSLLEAHRLREIGGRVDELFEIRDPTEAQLAELGRLTDETVRAILVDCPDDLLRKMAPAQRWRIILAFTARSMPASEHGLKKPANLRASA